MSIASEIARLRGVKADILRAISDKGVEVPSGSMLDDCPDLIASISGGGVGVPYLKNIMPVTGVKVADENGYIGGDFLNTGSTYYNNFSIVIPGADYSEEGLGQVTFTDPTVTIGGRVYRVITIGGATWLAENLDYKFSGCDIGSSGSPNTPAAWYYNDDEATYGEKGNKYGLLYNWHAVNFLNNNSSSLCPGWHVPTPNEWDALANAVGGTGVAGTKLKSSTGWPVGKGTDDFGFSAFPAGHRTTSSIFQDVGYVAYFWTSDGSTSSATIKRFSSNAEMYTNSYGSRFGFSVRLVKDS